MIEVESDYDVFYEFKLSIGLNPDKARYRGWSSNSIEEGYGPSGMAYVNESNRSHDATVDLNYSKEKYFPI